MDSRRQRTQSASSISSNPRLLKKHEPTLHHAHKVYSVVKRTLAKRSANRENLHQRQNFSNNFKEALPILQRCIVKSSREDQQAGTSLERPVTRHQLNKVQFVRKNSPDPQIHKPGLYSYSDHFDNKHFPKANASVATRPAKRPNRSAPARESLKMFGKQIATEETATTKTRHHRRGGDQPDQKQHHKDLSGDDLNEATKERAHGDCVTRQSKKRDKMHRKVDTEVGIGLNDAITELPRKRGKSSRKGEHTKISRRKHRSQHGSPDIEKTESATGSALEMEESTTLHTKLGSLECPEESEEKHHRDKKRKRRTKHRYPEAVTEALRKMGEHPIREAIKQYARVQETETEDTKLRYRHSHRDPFTELPRQHKSKKEKHSKHRRSLRVADTATAHSKISNKHGGRRAKEKVKSDHESETNSSETDKTGQASVESSSAAADSDKLSAKQSSQSTAQEENKRWLRFPKVPKSVNERQNGKSFLGMMKKSWTQRKGSGTSVDKETEHEASKLPEGYHFAQKTLQWHNYYRRRHNCPDLTLNLRMCKYATEWATHLAERNIFEYRSQGRYGENIFLVWTTYKRFNLNAKAAVDSWYDEGYDYDYSSETPGRATHFTQLIWKNTTQLGVGKNHNVKTGKVYVVCNYAPPGNLLGRFLDNVLPLQTKDKRQARRIASKENS